MAEQRRGGYEATGAAEELGPPPAGPAPGHVRVRRSARDATYEDLAAAVLVAHQRRDAGSCLCGWSELGRSHARHVAEVLRVAGALRW